MKRAELQAKPVLAFIGLSTLNVLLSSPPVLALDPSLDVSQYAHNAWTARDGFSLGNIYAMAQTPDGYLWLGGEFGLFRFDGVRSIPWQPPGGQHLPSNPYSLLVTRDGTLWIGTFAGLVSWSGGKLTRYPELDGLFVTSLLEDREGTVWAGTLGGSPGTPTGRLCAIRSGRAQCYTEDGAFGSFVWSLYEDSSGNLWAGAESGLWRWKPGPPRRYAIPGMRIGDLTKADDGRVLIGMSGAGLRHLAGDKVEPYRIRGAINPNRLLPDRDVDSNKMLRDRDGGLWIGTHNRGLIHVHQGRTDVFTKSDGLSGDIICSLFEDREGNVWVATTGGLDRFRELPVTTISVKQGLSSDRTYSVIAATDGGIWVATHDGLTKWRNGQTTIFRKANGLPDDAAQSLFRDDGGRIWVFTGHGLAYFKDGRFVAVNGVPSEEVYSITGDKGGNLWLSGNRGLSHLLEGRLVEHFPWSALGRREQAKVILADQGGVWLSFWTDGGALYFKDRQVRASYTAAHGLGRGHVPGLRLDRDGVLWAGTEEGGLSRIKDGRIAALTTRNGLPCDTIHWTIEDDDRSLWLYTGCGVVRIPRTELDAWIADPKRRIRTVVWDAADGVRLHSVSPAYFGPPVAKSTDGKLWFLTGEGVQVVDPRHLVVNEIPPPVHIEQVIADHKPYWQNLTGAAVSNVRLPPRTRDLQIDYNALSLVAPEKVHFKYKLEGQDRDWREVFNDRQAHYTNLPPRHYRFRVIACNNSGVWNEEGDVLDLSVAPAYYQTNWFRALCTAICLALLWAAYQFRVRQLQRQSKQLRDVIDTIPGYVWSALPDGSVDFINQRWLEFSSFSLEQAVGRGWEAAVHPDDLARFVDEWRAAVASGKAMESEARVRSADGQYRWLLIRNVPLRDKAGKIVKWYGTSTDIHDRKGAEEALSRSNRELRAISNCNQTLLRATDEQSLLDEICRIVCEEAGYHMAWVGYAEHDEAKSVRPVAWTGAEEGYLTNLSITWADTERWHGSTGTAIRTGKTCCIQDFATDPRLAPWRESALQRGFRSAIALPLKDEQANAFGSLTIHSAQPNAFTSEEIRLLEELAGDLAFGVVTLRSRAARKRAEEALRQSEAYLAEGQRLAHTGSWAWDPASGKYAYWSEEMFRIFGFGPQEGLPTKEEVLQRIHSEDRDGVNESLERSLREKVDTFGEYRFLLPDGTVRHIYVIRHPVLNSAGELVRLVGTSIDITERKRAEEERERLQRLEADLRHLNRVSMMGELTASIAHEVNQPLSGIVSNGSACLRWLAGDSPNLEEAQEAVRRIVRDGKRAGEVIARIRALTKRAASLREKLDLNETIAEVLALVGDEAKKNSVIIQARFADDLSPVSGDRVQLQQVMLNLIMNAIEAMNRMGDRARDLVITTRKTDSDQVQVTVEDSGTGLDPSTTDKIFDAFYTTKPGGMGMGLSISRSIVQTHGGRLWATAKDGAGTIFNFTLPTYHEEESNAGVGSINLPEAT